MPTAASSALYLHTDRNWRCASRARLGARLLLGLRPHLLASPLASDDEVLNASSTNPVSQAEKPTIAFVFRGVRRSFRNPYYNTAFSSGSNPNSQLPPEHPEFEPVERTDMRKFLFGRKKSAVALHHSMTAGR
ncbi:hypothetical protein B0H11DRAFT_1989934 [Mycena galericulata]|nr:hypothetical protein B0H11DRAFT_1989934 [Mycena galericulata]